MGEGWGGGGGRVVGGGGEFGVAWFGCVVGVGVVVVGGGEKRMVEACACCSKGKGSIVDGKVEEDLLNASRARMDEGGFPSAFMTLLVVDTLMSESKVG